MIIQNTIYINDNNTNINAYFIANIEIIGDMIFVTTSGTDINTTKMYVFDKKAKLLLQ